MEEFYIEMHKVHKLIDNYTERWAAEPERDEHKWAEMVEVFLLMSRLPRSSFGIMEEQAEDKKRWELHLQGALPNDEFGDKVSV